MKILIDSRNLGREESPGPEGSSDGVDESVSARRSGSPRRKHRITKTVSPAVRKINLSSEGSDVGAEPIRRVRAGEEASSPFVSLQS